MRHRRLQFPVAFRKVRGMADTPPDKSIRRPAWLRGVALLLITLVWFVVLGLAGEFVEALRERASHAAADAVGATSWSRAAQETAALCGKFGIAPPPPQGSDIVARNPFATLSPEARAAFAGERGEAIFVCSPDGRVLESYQHATLPALASAAELIASRGDLMAALEGMQADDARTALRLPGIQFREYELPRGDGSMEVAQFAFHPFAPEGPIGVFIRPSMWKDIWQNFRPGVRQDDAYQISINSHGFRDRDVVVPKPPGLYRIVCIGGSTTAEGPSNEITYPKLLERVLRARYGTDRIEVINAGVYASRSGNELDRIGQCLAMEPDLILHYNAVNDLTQWLPQWMQEDPLHVVKAVAGSSRLFYNHANTWLLPSDDALQREIRDKILGNLRSIRKATEEAGAQTAFASFTYPDYENLPRAEQAYFDRLINTMHWGRTINMASYVHLVRLYNAELKKMCGETGAPYLPLAEGFHHGADLFTDICHMHPHGMLAKAEALADLLAPVLQSRGLQPAPK